MIVSRRCKMLIAGIALVAGAALVASVLLTNGKRKIEPPPHKVMQAINDSLELYTDDEEINSLAEAYQKSGNPKLATADGTTLLHLACRAGHIDLVKHLLQQGADPNVESAACGLPIVCLFDIPRDKPAETKLMMNLLLTHGAKVGDFSRFSENLDEDTYIYLLEQAWKGDTGHNTGVLPAQNGWTEALRYVLEKAGTPLPNEYKTLIHDVVACAGYEPNSDQRYLDCVKLLVSKGVSVEQEDDNGTTPIMTAAKKALCDDLWVRKNGDLRYSTPYPVILQWLLQPGADVYRTFDKDPDFPGYCVYDLLMANKPLMDELNELGYTFDAPPPLDFTEGKALMDTVMRAELRCEAEDSLLNAFDQIATLLAPDDEMKSHPDYPAALCSAINLLMRADEERGTVAVATMPLWSDEDFWIRDSEDPLLVLQTLHDNAVALVPETLIKLAKKAEAVGHTGVAAELMELLAFSTVENEVLEDYTQDAGLPLQAGAWQAILLRNNLPAVKDKSISDWLKKHGQRPADTPDMQRARLLTEHHLIWDNRMTPQEQERLFADIEAIGEPETAAWYRRTAAKLDAAAEETQIDRKEREMHFFRLECATARFLLEHADMFAEEAE